MSSSSSTDNQSCTAVDNNPCVDYVIRIGTPADAQTIVDLIIELAVYEKEQNEVETTVVHYTTYK